MKSSERLARGRVDRLGGLFARFVDPLAPTWLTPAVGGLFLLIIVRACARFDCDPDALEVKAAEWHGRFQMLWRSCPALKPAEITRRLEAMLRELPVADGLEYEGDSPDEVALPVAAGGSVCGIPSPVPPLEPILAPKRLSTCCQAPLERGSGRCSSCGNKSRSIES